MSLFQFVDRWETAFKENPLVSWLYLVRHQQLFNVLS